MAKMVAAPVLETGGVPRSRITLRTGSTPLRRTTPFMMIGQIAPFCKEILALCIILLDANIAVSIKLRHGKEAPQSFKVGCN